MNETGFFRRLVALCRKEFVQLWRDSSSLLIGTVLPILLIIIIGSGVNLDVKNAPVAVVLEDASPTAQDAVSFLSGSAYFSPRYVTSRTEAVRLMDDREVNAILVVPADFSSKLGRREAKLQLIAYGTDPTTATSINSYVEAGVAAFNASRVAGHAPFGMVTVENRMWFNDAHSSTWYFVPGLMMLITTIVGVFLTSLVMAREWERGTLESLFVTPVRKEELLLAKIIPYFCIAMLGFFLCLLASRYLYGVPLHGSFIMLVISSVLYLFVALGIGLLISAATKSQFLASQVSLVLSLLPAMMLSGFLFDLRSVPAWVAAVGHALPSTYYLELLKSLFLAGNNWPLLGKNCVILAGYAVLLLGLAFLVTRKKVE